MQPDPDEASSSKTHLAVLWLLPIGMRLADLAALALGGASLSQKLSSGLGEAIVNWDGHWYLGIAASGYNYLSGTDSNVAFFPAFPLAMRYLGEIASISYAWAGVAISLAVSIVISPLAYAVVREQLGPKVGRRAAISLALFPTAFFFVLPYPEAAFVASVLAAFFFASKSRWWLAGTVGAVASALKVFGVLLAPAFLWMALDKANWNLGRLRCRPPALAAAAGIASLTGAASYCFYLWARFRNPAAFYSAQLDGWPHQRSAVFVPVIKTAGELLRPNSYIGGTRPDLYWAYLLDLMTVVAVVAILVLAVRKLNGTWILFWASASSLPLLSGTTNSFARYALSFFPFFAGLGWILRKKRLRLILWALFAGSQLVLAYLFGRGWWVG
ncbi:MAG: hypothetical protein C4319_09000 [Acidimicrobiia bacterium]